MRDKRLYFICSQYHGKIRTCILAKKELNCNLNSSFSSIDMIVVGRICKVKRTCRTKLWTLGQQRINRNGLVNRLGIKGYTLFVANSTEKVRSCVLAKKELNINLNSSFSSTDGYRQNSQG